MSTKISLDACKQFNELDAWPLTVFVLFTIFNQTKREKNTLKSCIHFAITGNEA